jgi:hypothetical protein
LLTAQRPPGATTPRRTARHLFTVRAELSQGRFRQSRKTEQRRPAQDIHAATWKDGR